jgi:hypothetical protein
LVVHMLPLRAPVATMDILLSSEHQVLQHASYI